jgi:epoxyqueuosine reductase
VERLLLHICCAPDGAYAIELLKPQYLILCYFFNPNIDNKEEYEKRLDDARKVAQKFDVGFLEPEYPVNEWLDCIKGLESEPEGGKRCKKCFDFRLKACAEAALKNKCDYFTSVLTISPHKNSRLIFEIGKRIETESRIKFLAQDFKKKDGFKKSVILSKELNLYRQNYCGCSFSKSPHSAARPPLQ